VLRNVPFYRRYHRVCLTCEVESWLPPQRPIWHPAAGMDGNLLSVWSQPCHRWWTHTAFVRYEKKSNNFSFHLQVACCNIFHRTDCIKCVKELLITLYYCISYRLVFSIGLWSPASHIGDPASVPDHRCGFCWTKCWRDNFQSEGFDPAPSTAVLPPFHINSCIVRGTDWNAPPPPLA
jgi:hypothetical protein